MMEPLPGAGLPARIGGVAGLGPSLETGKKEDGNGDPAHHTCPYTGVRRDIKKTPVISRQGLTYLESTS